MADDYAQKTINRSNFLEAIRSKAGCLYQWGAKGPMHFDCMGLVEWGLCHIAWYRHNMPDLSVKSGAYDFFKDCRVPKDKARPGDLLFYGDDPENVRHVMILNWPWSIIGARGGDSDVTTDQLAMQRMAGVQVEWLHEYWKGGLQIVVDPFLKMDK